MFAYACVYMPAYTCVDIHSRACVYTHARESMLRHARVYMYVHVRVYAHTGFCAHPPRPTQRSVPWQRKSTRGFGQGTLTVRPRPAGNTRAHACTHLHKHTCLCIYHSTTLPFSCLFFPCHVHHTFFPVSFHLLRSHEIPKREATKIKLIK